MFVFSKAAKAIFNAKVVSTNTLFLCQLHWQEVYEGSRNRKLTCYGLTAESWKSKVNSKYLWFRILATINVCLEWSYKKLGRLDNVLEVCHSCAAFGRLNLQQLIRIASQKKQCVATTIFQLFNGLCKNVVDVYGIAITTGSVFIHNSFSEPHHKRAASAAGHR